MNLLAALVPTIAVLIGMTLLKSAWLTILLYHAGIIAFIAPRKRPGLWKRAWSGARNSLTLPATLACALVAPIVYFMWPWFAASEGILPEWLATYGLTGLAWTLLIPYFALVHPILEEVHWRALDPAATPLLYWGDFLFAAYHVLVLLELVYWPWLFLVFGVLVASSAFWRWSANRFGGCAIAILTHAAADAGVLIGVCFLLQQ